MATYHIEEDFLEDYDSFRSHCDSIQYNGATSPVDGVFYPGVSDDIPSGISSFCKAKISTLIERDITLNFLFLRLSVEGVHVPHECHEDSSMGQYSFMLYMNRVDDCIGGTSFVIHKATGISSKPLNEKQISAWSKDYNNFDAWSITAMIDMIPNRALIFKASDMHRALPVGGFGDSSSDGRLVLTGFFDCD